MSSPVFVFSKSINLAPLRQVLWQQKIAHLYRVNTHEQLIILLDKSTFTRAQYLIAKWQSGESLPAILPAVSSRPIFWHYFIHNPVCWLLIILCIVVFALMQWFNLGIMHFLLIVPFQITFAGTWHLPLSQTLLSGQWWRIFTPALIHFNLMHLAFNLLWLWYLGSQIEFYRGSWFFLLLVLVTAGLSNFVEYYGATLFFGGMSGVVYGLLGYILWQQYIVRRSPMFELPPVLALFMLLWLLLGFTPIFVWLGFGQVAGLAHLAGLLVGFLFAILETGLRAWRQKLRQ